MFLSCNGVSQIIELNYLDGIRGHSLKAFETLIISLGEQQKDSSIPGTDGLDGEPKEPASFHAGTFVHSQQAFSDSPQSLSKFYASLREAHPKRRKSAPHDAHLHTINLFLCVAFLCVSKEADSDGESAIDSEDTSGYDSTASEPLCQELPCLPLESLVLPPPERMHQAADIWSMCRWIYMLSPAFQKQLCRLGGVRVCHKLIFMIIQRLFRGPDEDHRKKEDQEPLRTAHAEVAVEEDSGSSAVRSAPTPSGPGSPKGSAGSVGASESRAASTNGDPIPAAGAAPEEAKGPASRASETSLQSIRLLEALLAICLHGTRASQHRAELEPPGQVMTWLSCDVYFLKFCVLSTPVPGAGEDTGTQDQSLSSGNSQFKLCHMQNPHATRFPAKRH